MSLNVISDFFIYDFSIDRNNLASNVIIVIDILLEKCSKLATITFTQLVLGALNVETSSAMVKKCIFKVFNLMHHFFYV